MSAGCATGAAEDAAPWDGRWGHSRPPSAGFQAETVLACEAHLGLADREGDLVREMALDSRLTDFGLNQSLLCGPSSERLGWA